MKNGINMSFITSVILDSRNNFRSFNILFFILLFFSGCSDSYQVDPLKFKKMVSARNLGIAYLEEERYSDAVKEFEKLTTSSGFETIKFHTDEKNYFGIFFLKVKNN